MFGVLPLCFQPWCGTLALSTKGILMTKLSNAQHLELLRQELHSAQFKLRVTYRCDIREMLLNQIVCLKYDISILED